MLPSVLPKIAKTTVAATAALSIALASTSPAMALGDKEKGFLQGVAATLLLGAIVKDGQRRAVQPAPQQPVPQPQPTPVGGGYAVPLYQTPAAIAFNSYSSSQRRAIQQRLAGLPSSISRANDFTSTVWSGNVQPRYGVKSMSESAPGKASQRSLCAPSDQSGEFTEYGISADSITWPFTERNRPLALRVRGNEDGACSLGVGSSVYSPPWSLPR